MYKAKANLSRGGGTLSVGVKSQNLKNYFETVLRQNTVLGSWDLNITCEMTPLICVR